MVASFNNLWAIADLDGTLCDCTHRVAFANTAVGIADKVKRAEAWDRFHERCPEDPPHLGEIMICRAWVASGGRLAYITGRHAKYRVLTQAWLAEQGLPIVPLFMRDDGNYNGAVDYKMQMFQLLKRHLAPGDEIAWVMEDQTRLVTHWRSIGLTCLQPRRAAYGDLR